MANDRDVQVAEYEWDFATDGGGTGNIPFRNLNTSGGSGLSTSDTVIDVQVYVETGLTSGGAATIKIGTTNDTEDFALQANYSNLTTGLVLGMWQMTGNAYWDTNQPKPWRPGDAADTLPQLTVETADLTAGKIILRFCYIQD